MRTHFKILMRCSQRQRDAGDALTKHWPRLRGKRESEECRGRAGGVEVGVGRGRGGGGVVHASIIQSTTESGIREMRNTLHGVGRTHSALAAGCRGGERGVSRRRASRCFCLATEAKKLRNATWNADKNDN